MPELNPLSRVRERGRGEGETRYTEGVAPTDFRYTGQRFESLLGLHDYGARWYDSLLGRWLQPDSIVPLESQGVQAWDRYAYANNNPVRYNDPTGHDVGCAGRDASECKKPIPVCSIETPTKSVSTNSIMLKGGPGATTSYGKSAEDSWTGFGGSGESSNPIISGLVGAPGLINDLLVLGRDNTNFRELLGNQPEVSGNVYYDLAETGWKITGASISNHSFESISITAIRTETYSIYGDNKIASDRLYPYPRTSLQTPDYGVAPPGFSSGTVNLSSRIIPNWNYVNVSIFVRSNSGRFGSLGVSLSVNKP
jgi:RHS repeat-associated protein